MSAPEQQRSEALPETAVENRSSHAGALHRPRAGVDEPLPACGEGDRPGVEFRRVTVRHHLGFKSLCQHPECFGKPELVTDGGRERGGVEIVGSYELAALRRAAIRERLRELLAPGEMRYLRARDVAAETDVSAKSVGQQFRSWEGETFAVEQWGNDSQRRNTWRVTRREDE